MTSQTRYSFGQLAGAEPVFLLDVVWGGQTYRFSSYPLDLDSDDGKITYSGGLDDFVFSEASELIGINVEANQVNASVIFDEVDFLQRWARGQTLAGATGEFSYVLTKNGAVQQSYEERVVLLTGLVEEPQFGDPEEPEGSVQFTVQRQVYDSGIPLLDGSLRIDERFPDRDKNSADGKLWPLVFGSAGSINVSGSSSVTPATPTYAYYLDTSGPPPYTTWRIRFIISAGFVEASSVTLWDSLGASEVKSVLFDTDSYGNAYSYIETDLAGPGDPTTPIDFINNSDLRPDSWWVSWHNGGGIQNPFGEGSLTGGGDICLWALDRSRMPVDTQAWTNILSILNGYSFSGYINDPEVTAWQWLQSNILPYLPIEVRNGPRGVYPVLNALYGVSSPIIRAKITEGSDWRQDGPIVTEEKTDELLNELTLMYAKDNHGDSYIQSAVCGATYVDDTSVPSEYAAVSQNRFGLKRQTIQTPYIYDTATAKLVAERIVRARSLPWLTIDFVASAHFGWIQVGDLLAISSSRLYLDQITMIVLERRWQGGAWRYKLMFEVNPSLDKRAV